MKLAAEAIVVMRQGGREVLHAVSCTIPPGRLTGIIGPNGAGKSTLLKALAGLFRPSAGQVLLDGADLFAMGRRELARAVAYLPQERSVHWPLAVEDIVALGRLPHRAGPSGARSEADDAAIAAAMQAMDLRNLASRQVDQISGGELARVLIARALAQQSRIILADEPTSGLDPLHALDLFRILAALAADGKAVAVALHDLSLAARFCHDIVVLAEGRVAASGRVQEVLTPQRLAPVFGVRFATGEIEGLPVVLPLAPLAMRPSPGGHDVAG